MIEIEKLKKLKDAKSIIEKTFTSNGFKCIVLFCRQTHRCGYVRIPKGHLAHGVEYDNINVDVHGGLTYSSHHKPSLTGNKTPLDEAWWIGFDCAHLGDKMAYYKDDSTDHWWTTEEVKEELIKLTRQLRVLKAGDTLPYEINNFLMNTSIKKMTQLKKEVGDKE